MKRGTVSCLCVLKSGSSWEVEETGETEETGYPPCTSPVGVMLSEHPSQDGDRFVCFLRNVGPSRAWQ